MELKHSINLTVKRHVIVYLAMSDLNTELSSWTYWTFYLDIMIRKENFLDRCAETFKIWLTLYQSGKKFHQQTKSTDCQDIFLYLIKAKPWSLMYQSWLFIYHLFTNPVSMSPKCEIWIKLLDHLHGISIGWFILPKHHEIWYRGEAEGPFRECEGSMNHPT